MRLRFVIAVLAVVAVAAPLATHRSVSATPSLCGDPGNYDIVASGGATYGTAGDDWILGSPGDDTIYGLGGNDYICDEAGNNLLDGGKDDDHLLGVGTLRGGSGRDCVVAYGEGSLADGGSGDDWEVLGYDGASANGGSGSEYDVYAEDGGAADGGSGNDWVFGYYASALFGGSGKDFVVNEGGDPRMDCGSAYDQYDPNGATSIRRCEDESSFCDDSISSVAVADVVIQC